MHSNEMFQQILSKIEFSSLAFGKFLEIFIPTNYTPSATIAMWYSSKIRSEKMSSLQKDPTKFFVILIII